MSNELKTLNVAQLQMLREFQVRLSRQRQEAGDTAMANAFLCLAGIVDEAMEEQAAAWQQARHILEDEDGEWTPEV